MADPIISSVVTFAAATGPIFVGLALPRIFQQWQGKEKSLPFGVAIGVLFASFFDLMKETAGLGTSTLKSVVDFLNLVALGAGLLLFLFLSFYAKRSGDRGGSLALLYFWALIGVGLHSAGEGMVIGYDFSTGATVLSLYQISSFALHKGAEGFTIGLLYLEGGHTWKHGAFSGLLGGFPILIGTLAGLSGYPATLATYSFAAGAGATIYLFTRLMPLANTSPSRAVLGIFLGFLYMYLSGVLHQFQ